MGSGRIVSVIGAVIDVEFPREEVPEVYEALKVDEKGLTLEVQQQLGDGVVRTIAMGTSEGVSRGLAVTNTKEPIMVREVILLRATFLPSTDAIYSKLLCFDRVPIGMSFPFDRVLKTFVMSFPSKACCVTGL